MLTQFEGERERNDEQRRGAGNGNNSPNIGGHDNGGPSVEEFDIKKHFANLCILKMENRKKVEKLSEELLVANSNYNKFEADNYDSLYRLRFENERINLPVQQTFSPTFVEELYFTTDTAAAARNNAKVDLQNKLQAQLRNIKNEANTLQCRLSQLSELGKSIDSEMQILSSVIGSNKDNSATSQPIPITAANNNNNNANRS